MVGTGTKRPPYGEGRRALLDATIALVAREGLSRLTYRALAQEAGVTHGNVQHHFASLDVALEEALEHCLGLSLATLDVDPGDSSPQAFVSQLVDFVDADPQLQLFQFELVIESRRRPSLQPGVLRLYEAYREATRAAVAGMGLDADDALVRAVFAAADGLVFQYVTMGPFAEERPRDAVEGLRRLLEAALRTSTSAP